MLAVFIVLLCVFLPYCIMAFGVITIFRSRNSGRIKETRNGVLFTALGGLMLIAASAVMVNEMIKHAPYLQEFSLYLNIVSLIMLMPYCILASGIIILFKSHNDETTRGMHIGLRLAILGGLLLIAVSAVIVHELLKYASYF